ncbi:MAG: HAMP domain-containing protein, partial [Dehalococcoidia bacterium]
FSFGRTRDTATTRSREGLEAQGRAAMLSSAIANAGFGHVILNEAVAKGHDAARFMESISASGTAPPADPGQLSRAPSGALYDASPARTTDVWSPTSTQLDDAFARDLADSAVLDALFPALFDPGDSSPSGSDTTRLFFLSARGFMRSYPTRIAPADELPPELAPVQQQLLRSAGPAADPQRAVIWSDTHDDPAAGGLLISAYTPVYSDDEYRGLIGVDLSLASLLAKADAIEVTPNGYAFVIDRNGGLLPGASSDIIRREMSNSENSGFAQIIERMRAGDTDARRVTVNGQAVFVAYSPLGSYGGSLALVAPVDDVTAEAADVTSAIRKEGNRTEMITIGTMVAFLVLALVGAAWLNRALLTRPIAELVRGTKAVATGDLSARIPSGSRDELGALAISFNMMTDELRGRRDALRAEMAERRRAENELHALFAAMTDLVLVLDREGTLLRQAPTRAAEHPIGDADETGIIGRTAGELLGETQAAPLVEAIRNSLTTGDTETVEYSLTVAGEQRWFSAMISPLTDETVVWVARDVTEIVGAQRLLERRVEERTRELSALLDISRGIASTLEPQRLVGVIFEQLRRIIDFNGSSVLVLRGDALVVLDFDRTNFPDLQTR